MGMKSRFLEQKIKVKKPIPDELLKDLGKTGLVIGQKINFIAWDDYKLQGYWYDETIQVLNRLAPYIEGYAEFFMKKDTISA